MLLTATGSYAQKNYEMGNPNDPNYSYLKDYGPLKSYVDREKYPNFKLGVGTTVNNYLSNSTVKGLTNDNFDETVALTSRALRTSLPKTMPIAQRASTS